VHGRLGLERVTKNRSLAVAGYASLGAGAIHAVAVGMHSEHRQAVLAFTAVAAFQLAWGALALTWSDRWLAWAGAFGNTLVIGGWVLAKTAGIGFVDGLDTAEGVQTADLLAALLAGVAVLGALVSVFGADAPVRNAGGAQPFASSAIVAIAGLAVVGMVTAGTHAHGHGAASHAEAGHSHEAASGNSAAHHAQQPVQAVAPKPYDPTQPVDLGGVEGVTPEQQARAEQLVTVSLEKLPKYADTATAEADGFRWIGDNTPEMHYVNWSYVNDGRILDPDYPESLVYRSENGQRVLVAAMYMLSEADTLETAPDIGGKLTQWHVHRDLCLTADPVAPRLAGFTSTDAPCSPPLVKRVMPMIHVWIVPHECGPFAALAGIGGGQIAAGEERLCDHAHGSLL
jgi:hypothetical protein